jgi:hypothetical protein
MPASVPGDIVWVSRDDLASDIVGLSGDSPNGLAAFRLVRLI